MTEETLKSMRKYKEEAVLLEEKRQKRLEVLNNIQNLVEEIDKSQQVINNVFDPKNSKIDIKESIHKNFDHKNEINISQNLDDPILTLNDQMNEPIHSNLDVLLYNSNHTGFFNKENYGPPEYNNQEYLNFDHRKNETQISIQKFNFSNIQNKFICSETCPKKEIDLPSKNAIINVESLSKLSPYIAKQMILSNETEESIDSGFISNRKSDQDSEQNLNQISVALQNIQESLKSFSNVKKCTHAHSRNAAMSNILQDLDHAGLKMDNTINNLNNLNKCVDLNDRESPIVSNISLNNNLNCSNLKDPKNINEIFLKDPLLIMSNPSINSLILNLEKGQNNSKDKNGLSSAVESSDESSNQSGLIEQYKILLQNSDIENSITNISQSINDNSMNLNKHKSNNLNKNMRPVFANKNDSKFITSGSTTYESCELNIEPNSNSKDGSDENLRTQKFVLKNKIFIEERLLGHLNDEMIYTHLDLPENDKECIKLKNLNSEYKFVEYLDLAKLDEKVFLKDILYFKNNKISNDVKIDGTNTSCSLSILSNISSIHENTELSMENVNPITGEDMERFHGHIDNSNQRQIDNYEDSNIKNESINTLSERQQISDLLENNFEDITDKNIIETSKGQSINSNKLSVIQKVNKSNAIYKKHRRNQTFSKKYSESNSSNINTENVNKSSLNYNNDKMKQQNLENVPIQVVSQINKSITNLKNNSVINFDEKHTKYNNNFNTRVSFSQEGDEAESLNLKRLEKKLELMRRHHRIQMEQLLIRQEQEQLLLQQEILSARQWLVSRNREFNCRGNVDRGAVKGEIFVSNGEVSRSNFCSEASVVCQKNQDTLTFNDYSLMNLDTTCNQNSDSFNDYFNINNHYSSRNNLNESFKDGNNLNNDFININNDSLSKNNLNKSFQKNTINNITYSEKSPYKDKLNESFVTDISKAFDCINDRNCNKIADFNSTFNFVDEKLLNAGRILFNKLGAFVKGYLTRRILKSNRVQFIIQTIKDTAALAETIQRDILTKPAEDEILLLDRIDKQLTSALYDFYDIFFEISVCQRMNIISQQKLLEKEIMFKQVQKVDKKANRLSAATVKLIERKQKIILDDENYIGRNKAFKNSPLSQKSKAITKPKDRIAPKKSSKNKIAFKDDDDLSSCSSLSILNLKHLQQPNFYYPLKSDKGINDGNKGFLEQNMHKDELIPLKKKNNIIVSKSKPLKSNVKTKFASKPHFK